MAAIASWHDYFVLGGGVSGALTGVVFVAMTLHLEEITGNVVHRHRARTILTGLTAVFIRCGLVLMGGQDNRAVAVDLVVVLTVVEIILYTSIRLAMRSADQGVLLRTIGSFACLLLEEAGAAVLFFGNPRGIYFVGLGMMSSFIFMVTGAWLLLVGVGAQEAATRAESAPPPPSPARRRP